jgi:hypothetical protein
MAPANDQDSREMRYIDITPFDHGLRSPEPPGGSFSRADLALIGFAVETNIVSNPFIGRTHAQDGDFPPRSAQGLASIDDTNASAPEGGRTGAPLA